ncbi:MAG: DUF1800 domain-containing protein [Chloroflexota bacterium]
MNLTRREFLRLAGLLGAGAALSACSPIYAQLSRQTQPFAGWEPTKLEPGNAHFGILNRLTFGPRPEERLHAAQIGLPAWIEEQLAPHSIEDTRCELLLRRFDTLRMSAADLHDWSDKLFDAQDKTSVPAELRQAAMIRQVYSHRQLYEVMVDFWSDHFNVSVEKGECWYLKTIDDRQVIRPHALGKFRDLLWASAHSPAMLVYLDNQSSSKGMPNENYARELMELHTLGVGSGYTQQDVMELARCFTGWSVKEHFWRGEFFYDPARHDPGQKMVLGIVIAPAGQAEAEQILDKLARHPSTAHFIAAKLARRFIADDPPSAAVSRASQAFLDSDGDIPSVLRALLLGEYASPDSPAFRAKFKRPARFIVSALRMLAAQTDGGAPIQEYLARLGQPYFGWPTPDGYPDSSQAWLGNLMPRWQFAYDLAANQLKGTRLDLEQIAAAGTRSPAGLLDFLSILLFGAPLPETRAQALLDALYKAGTSTSEMTPALLASLLASPEFQWH